MSISVTSRSHGSTAGKRAQPASPHPPVASSSEVPPPPKRSRVGPSFPPPAALPVLDPPLMSSSAGGAVPLPVAPAGDPNRVCFFLPVSFDCPSDLTFVPLSLAMFPNIVATDAPNIICFALRVVLGPSGAICASPSRLIVFRVRLISPLLVANSLLWCLLEALLMRGSSWILFPVSYLLLFPRPLFLPLLGPALQVLSTSYTVLPLFHLLYLPRGSLLRLLLPIRLPVSRRILPFSCSTSIIVFRSS